MGALLDLIYELRLAHLAVHTLPREMWAGEIGVSENTLSRMFWLPTGRAPRASPLGSACVVTFLEYLDKLGLSGGVRPSDVRSMLDSSWVEPKGERVEQLFALVLQKLAEANKGFTGTPGTD